MSTTSPWLLEASWEVCNKVGGIHTVIVSKLPSVLADYGDQYLSIGPWLAGHQPEFKASTPSASWSSLFAQLAEQGVAAHYGHWQVPGQPAVLLLDWQGLVPKLSSLKTRFWEEHQLDSLGSDFYDFDVPLLWGYSVGLLAEAISKQEQTKVTLQLHEWLSAGAFLSLSTNNPSLRTVFTTHATVLGRSLVGHGVPLYETLHEINPDDAAKEYGVVAKHQLERLGATLATAFTTVSDLTAEEATQLLGRHPNVVTENGLAIHELPLLLANRSVAAQVRGELEQFVDDMFAPYYSYSSKRALWQVTTGRFELHNKGYDLYLASLAELNTQLKAANSPDSVVALLLIATGNRGITQEALSARLLRYQNQPDKLTAFAQSTVPLSPFIPDPNDPIPSFARNLGLANGADDRVKIIYLPAYFDGFDGLLNIPLYDLIAATDLGVFPSAYEPWGYTPLECIALGVPAITSDLAGFGQAVRQATNGVQVLKRRGIEDSTASLTDLLLGALRLTPRELELERIGAYGLSQQFSWDRLYVNYQTAYQQAWQ